MNKERLLELAGIPLVEGMPKTTKENPLVSIWDSAESKEYPEQGLSGHMHLTTAQNIYKFEMKGFLGREHGLAEELWKAGVGKRVKAGKVWLEMSKWTKKEIKAGGRDEAIAADKKDLKEVYDSDLSEKVLRAFEGIDKAVAKTHDVMEAEGIYSEDMFELMSSHLEDLMREFQ